MNIKIDTDFAHNRRDDVLKYLYAKYGSGFSHIGTFSVSQGRGLFKDICRIMEVPFATSNELAKLIPESASYESVDKSLEDSPELKAKYDSDPLIKEIVDMAKEMEGCVKSLGIHAAGVILADEPISDYVPQFASKDMPVTQFDAHIVEDVGFLKIDILGLKTLSVIRQTFDYILQTKNISLDMKSIPLDDDETYKLFLDKNTLGVFQMEAQMMTDYASKCRPKTIMEISNIISLVRPGPLGIPGCLSNYAKACNGEIKSDFIFPEFNHIFSETYGMLIYQEQLSRLSMEMCGFSGPKSDELRKAVSKKNREDLLKLRDEFIDGAVRNGYERSAICKMFDDMEEFSRYCFNLSHAISYSHLTYFTAYLKTHYPSEFFAACISLEEDADQKSKYIDDARNNGLDVLPPDINLSNESFTIAKDGSILFGFNGIKGLGPAVIRKIIESRSYNNFADFLIKSCIIKGINKKSIEALINSGSLDCFGLNHSCMIQSFEKYILDLTDNGKLKELTPERIALFLAKHDEYFNNNSCQEYSVFTILQKEKELMGVYISGNPFDLIGSLVDEDFYPVSRIEAMLAPSIKSREYVLCEIIKIKKHQVASGDIMAFVDCKDHEGNAFSLIFFADKWEKFQPICFEGNYIMAFCEFSVGNRGFSALVLNCIDLSSRIQKSNLSASKKLNSIGIHILGVPSTARVKTIQNKLLQYSDDSGNASINLYLDIDKYVFFIKSIPVKSIDIDVIRDLNKIPDIYVSRIESK